MNKKANSSNLDVRVFVLAVHPLPQHGIGLHNKKRPLIIGTATSQGSQHKGRRIIATSILDTKPDLKPSQGKQNLNINRTWHFNDYFE